MKSTLKLENTLKLIPNYVSDLHFDYVLKFEFVLIYKDDWKLLHHLIISSVVENYTYRAVKNNYLVVNFNNECINSYYININVFTFSRSCLQFAIQIIYLIEKQFLISYILFLPVWFRDIVH